MLQVVGTNTFTVCIMAFCVISYICVNVLSFEFSLFGFRSLQHISTGLNFSGHMGWIYCLVICGWCTVADAQFRVLFFVFFFREIKLYCCKKWVEFHTVITQHKRLLVQVCSISGAKVAEKNINYIITCRGHIHLKKNSKLVNKKYVNHKNQPHY